MTKPIQLTIRVSEKLNERVIEAHNKFCKSHLIGASFNSYLAHLLEIGLEEEGKRK